MSTTRKPAITRTTSHPADTIPDRPAVPITAAPPDSSQLASSPQAGGAAERLTEQHNVRIRPSTKNRLGKAVDKLRYETGDRTISIASITDQALDAYLTQHGC
ncbi:MAG: hypothetical protein QG671_1921 [Actinomycetota bacterium]|uniref:Uncharacterized protein n=1 Tax=Mycolicibacterium hippocampi TaxID=659824 RepID=A0A850PS13_9MYCO|nr:MULTISPECIES: hypothetical protein [Mycobacteriaceae]MDQ1306089.1 hypothetical protein [Actinomycetota bacterium]MDV3130369.1 hypothetical protein [Mycobacterium sp. 21AC1]NVN51273.1 hypothetical protein [Mycolicibacterium hippocampi]